MKYLLGLEAWYWVSKNRITGFEIGIVLFTILPLKAWGILRQPNENYNQKTCQCKTSKEIHNFLI